MTDSASSTPETKTRRKRKPSRLPIILPFVLTLLIVIFMVVGAALLGTEQSGLIADWMFTILVMCPLVLCSIVVLVALVAAMWGVDKLNRGTTPLLQRLEDFSQTGHTRVNALSEQIKRYIIEGNEKIEPVMSRMDVFDDTRDRRNELKARKQESQEDNDESADSVN